MSAELKECPFCGSAAMLEDHRTIWRVACASLECGAQVLGDCAPEPDGEMGDAYWAAYKKTAIDRWNARAIAPPVAAGSIDTEEFRRLCRAYYQEQPSLRESDRLRLVAHVDSWGAQQREAGKMEAIATLMPRINHHSERAEKAEARVNDLERESGHKQSIIDRLMLEYCPNEMTAEQMAEWASRQKRAE